MTAICKHVAEHLRVHVCLCVWVFRASVWLRVCLQIPTVTQGKGEEGEEGEIY